MVGFFYMIYDFPCIINKPSFYVIDVHAVLIVKDITGTIQYQCQVTFIISNFKKK